VLSLSCSPLLSLPRFKRTIWRINILMVYHFRIIKNISDANFIYQPKYKTKAYRRTRKEKKMHTQSNFSWNKCYDIQVVSGDTCIFHFVAHLACYKFNMKAHCRFNNAPNSTEQQADFNFKTHYKSQNQYNGGGAKRKKNEKIKIKLVSKNTDIVSFISWPS
jgi:hypothetical protein